MKANFNSLRTQLSIFALANILFSIPLYASDTDLGNITFVGDSITNGGSAKGATASNQARCGGTAASWRYALWKHLLDNGYNDKTQGNSSDKVNQPLALKGKDFQMVGTVNRFANNDAELNALATEYLGKAFHNIHEGHDGWRAAGHAGKFARTNKPGSGYVGNWISNNGKNGGPRYDSKPSTGWSDNEKDQNYWGKQILAPVSKFTPNTYSPDTVVILLGVNDIDAYTGEEVYQNVGEIVRLYQISNPKAKFAISTILDSNRNRKNVTDYNTLILDTPKDSSDWRYGKTNIITFNGNLGYNQNMCYDNLHLGAQGALIFSSNVARALGVGQRSVGQERRDASHQNFTQVKLSATKGAWKSISKSINGNKKTYFELKSEKNSSASAFKIPGIKLDASSNNTVNIVFQMDDDSNKNTFSINLANGNDKNGQLDIYPNEIRWKGTNATYTQGSPESGLVLYTGVLLNKEMNNLRVAWIQKDQTLGLNEGYYVWLNGVLIGEALQGDSSNNITNNKNGILLGGLIPDGETMVSIESISYCSTQSLAPIGETIREFPNNIAQAIKITPRIWTNAKGKKIVGKLISLNNGTATISTEGKNIKIPVNGLSKEDQQVLQAYSSKSK